MTLSHRVAGMAVAVTAALLVTACGSGQAAPGTDHVPPLAATGTASPAPAASPALDGCFTPALGRIETVPDAGNGTLTIGIMGTGPRVVIMSDQSDEDLCSWLPVAARLVAAGYRVVLWDYGASTQYDELAILVKHLRAGGATGVVLMGASEGAKASLIAGAQISPAVQGVVSLSAEATLQPAITVADYVRHLRCALLLVTADDDLYGSASAARQFLAVAPGRVKSLVRVPGSDHGTALLAGRSAATTLPAVLAFLHRQLP